MKIQSFRNFLLSIFNLRVSSTKNLIRDLFTAKLFFLNQLLFIFLFALGISKVAAQRTCPLITLSPFSNFNASPNSAPTTLYPNPFPTAINFNLHSSITGRGSLAIYDMLGRKVASVFEGDLVAGSEKTVSYEMRKTGREPLIYIFKIGSEIIEGKLLSGQY